MLTLKYAESRKPSYRLAVVVSKKVSKSAVVRNRIRRRIYEQVRREFQETPPRRPVDMVITVFDEGFKTMPAENLQAAVASLLKKTTP